MSTQDDAGIGFSILPEEGQQHFRLLELPAELLDLLTSERPQALQLKSATGVGSNSNAVLCSLDTTYEIRQVNTSNSVYVAQAIETSDDGSFLPKTGLQAIAHCQSLLEVLPASNKSAVPLITAILPTYTSTGHYSSRDAISREQLFADLPLSDAECDKGWNELCCFELEESRRSVVPSASVVLQAWQSMLNTATAMGIDLYQPLPNRDQSTLIGADNEWPDELSKALLRSMATSPFGANSIQLEESKCASQVGLSLLKDRTEKPNKPIALEELKMKWADLLPEKWRKTADLTLLKGWYCLESDGRDVSFASHSVENGVTSDGSAPAESKSALGAKRKWHDKFRASKKTA